MSSIIILIIVVVILTIVIGSVGSRCAHLPVVAVYAGASALSGLYLVGDNSAASEQSVHASARVAGLRMTVAASEQRYQHQISYK